MTLQQGIYPEIDEVTYHGDPCPRPSLNQTTAKILLTRSPRHAWHQHPRLNPNWHPDGDKKFDVGNLAHRRLTGRGREVVIVNEDSWRTKASQALRAAAESAGKLPVLCRQWESVDEMVNAARPQMRDAGLEWKPETTPGVMSEVALLWSPPSGDGEPVHSGGWFRTKIDRLQDGCSIDFKTTQGEATTRAIEYRMIDDGWPMQAAFHEWGLNVLIPDKAGRHKFLFVVQETYAPYALVVYEMPESVLSLGRNQLNKAVEIWRECLRTKRWPSYCNGQVGRLEVPTWALQQSINQGGVHAEVE